MESEWQPAVLVNGHSLPKHPTFFAGMVFVRPAVLREEDENDNPCWPDGKWYEVQGEDRFIVCGHEILTD